MERSNRSVILNLNIAKKEYIKHIISSLFVSRFTYNPPVDFLVFVKHMQKAWMIINYHELSTSKNKKSNFVECIISKNLKKYADFLFRSPGSVEFPYITFGIYCDRLQAYRR